MHSLLLLLIGERQNSYVYYRCHNKDCCGVSVREDRLSTSLETLFDSIRLGPQHLAALKEEVSSFLQEKRAGTRACDSDREIAKIEARMDRLLDEHLDR